MAVLFFGNGWLLGVAMKAPSRGSEELLPCIHSIRCNQKSKPGPGIAYKDIEDQQLPLIDAAAPLSIRPAAIPKPGMENKKKWQVWCHSPWDSVSA